MKKVDVSSMFLVPKNVYTSMLSHIHEDDIREDIKSLNQKRDDGNYIEKAIDFNKQQERQKNQAFIKPNLNNETIGTHTNTNNDTIRTVNHNQSATNTEGTFTPSINETIKAVSSTPIRSQAASIVASTPKKPALNVPMLSIKESLFQTDENGKFTCLFHNEKFPTQNSLREHYINKHETNMTRFELSSLSDKTPENSSIQDSQFYTPSNVSLKNTGAISKQTEDKKDDKSSTSSLEASFAEEKNSNKRLSASKNLNKRLSASLPDVSITDSGIRKSKRERKPKYDENEYELPSYARNKSSKKQYDKGTSQIFKEKNKKEK